MSNSTKAQNPVTRIPFFPARDGEIKTYHTLQLKNTRHRFGIGCVQRGEEARREFQGPMVPGPWAYTYGLCTVIDNYGGTGRESAEKLAEGTEHIVEDGNLLEIDDVVYEVNVYRREYIRLVEVCRL